MNPANNTQTNADESRAAPLGRGWLWVYLLLSMLILVYVAALTGNRSERLDADALPVTGGGVF